VDVGCELAVSAVMGVWKSTQKEARGRAGLPGELCEFQAVKQASGEGACLTFVQLP
jgi:hypothetical protein